MLGLGERLAISGCRSWACGKSVHGQFFHSSRTTHQRRDEHPVVQELSVLCPCFGTQVRQQPPSLRRGCSGWSKAVGWSLSRRASLLLNGRSVLRLLAALRSRYSVRADRSEADCASSVSKSGRGLNDSSATACREDILLCAPRSPRGHIIGCVIPDLPTLMRRGF